MARGIVNVMGRSVVRGGEDGQDADIDLLSNCCEFKEEIGVMRFFAKVKGGPFILRGWRSFICELRGSMMLLRSVS